MEIKEIKKKLIVGGYSYSTIQTYITCLKYFKNYFYKIEIDQLSKDDIIEYLFHLIKNNYSKSTQNQHINAIKFYFENVWENKESITLLKDQEKKRSCQIFLVKKKFNFYLIVLIT